MTVVQFSGVSPSYPSHDPMLLRPDCATAFVDLLTAYATQNSAYLPVDEGYRDLATQQYWIDYWTARGLPGNAAPLGTSNHGWGTAVDFYTSVDSGTPQHGWLRDNAATYGFSPLTYEPWHWNFEGSYSSVPPAPTLQPGFVIQSNVGNAHLYSALGSDSNTFQGMAAGTNPSTARLSTGNSVAVYQTNTGTLGVNITGSTPVVLGYGLRAGTSPSVTALDSGNYAIAFQSNTGQLHVWTSNGGDTNTLQGMASGTSPSIAKMGSGYIVAFQSNIGNLYLYQVQPGVSPSSTNTLQGMKAGSSPAVSTAAGGAYVAAFQANNSSLYTYVGGASFNTGIGMYGSTSPSIAGLTDGTYIVAVEANTTDLWTYHSQQGAKNLRMGMKAGSSPAVAKLDNKNYAIGIQSNVGRLFIWSSDRSNGTDTGLGMAGTTSPGAG